MDQTTIDRLTKKFALTGKRTTDSILAGTGLQRNKDGEWLISDTAKQYLMLMLMLDSYDHLHDCFDLLYKFGNLTPAHHAAVAQLINDYSAQERAEKQNHRK